MVEGLAGELSRLSQEGVSGEGGIAPFRFIRIDGGVTSELRMQSVRQFQTDPDTKIALLSIMAAGTGLTFTAGSHVVFAELNWTPGILQVGECDVAKTLSTVKYCCKDLFVAELGNLVFSCVNCFASFLENHLLSCTMARNNQESRRMYWATISFVSSHCSLTPKLVAK